MLDVIIFKYWKQLLVVLMVGLVGTYVGVSVYSLNVALTQTQTPESKAVTAKLNEQTDNKTQTAYKKSLTVFEKIQELKDKKKDTAELEKMYASTVKNLTEQNYTEAEKQLEVIDSHIAKIDTTLVATASAEASITPEITPAPEFDSENGLGSASAEID